jgi:26S proteasome regulatory subunit N12
VPEFEQHMAVLRTYYDEDFKRIIPESQKMYTVLGLYLLYLLAFNKISEYHTEIELIPLREQHENPFIQVPVSLEQHFVEGSYGKILSLRRQQVPHPAYQVFIDKFSDAIRHEVARSAEKAYESLAVTDALRLFMIQSDLELTAFIAANQAKAAEAGVEWRVENGRLWFVRQRTDAKEIPNTRMIGTCLEYATELNRIV